MRTVRIPFFRIWYSTTYTIIFVILLLLLCVTPGDIVYQSWRAKRIPNMFIVGGCCVLTAVLVLLVYSTRLYTNRTVLAAIPKSYMPVEAGEVRRGVRRMIVKQLERSAIIAWDARPRDIRLEKADSTSTRPSTAQNQSVKVQQRQKANHFDATVIPISADSPPWGPIAHPGWSSPASVDLPNLQFWQVLLELPNLVEAKAVSLAPADPLFNGAEAQAIGRPLIPDARVVALLQRPTTMGLRDYVEHLTLLGLINPPTIGNRFVNKYEQARFSATAISEAAFRELTAIFADMLEGMVELIPENLERFGLRDSGSDRSTASNLTDSSAGSVRRHAMPRAESMSSSSLDSLATVMHSWHSAR